MEKIKAAFGSKTFKQSLITFSGTGINGLLGAIFFILMARYLGPAMFGLFSVAIATLTLTADVVDLGTDTGIVQFVSKYASKAPEKAKRFLKLGLFVNLAGGALIIILGFTLAPFIAQTVFHKPDLTIPLKISSIGVTGALLFSLITNSLQGYQKFWWWSGIQILTNALRLIVLLMLLYFGLVNLNNALFNYIALPLLGFVIGYFLLPKNFLSVKKEFSVAKEFFHYNKWVAAFTLVAAVSARLDTFISARLLPATEVGIYSAAQRLVQIVPQIVSAVGTVIGPKMASQGNMKSFVSYLKKTQVMVTGLTILGLLAIPAAIFLIPVFYGAEYLASVQLFIVLLIAMLVFLFSVPIHQAVFHYFAQPKLFLWIAIGHLAIIGIGGWYLIGAYGAMGAAIVVLIGTIFNFIVPMFWVLKKIRSGRK